MTVASQASVFVPTRDPETLLAKKDGIESDLLDKATEAVATLNRRDDATRRALRERLKGVWRGATFNGFQVFGT